MHSTSAAEARDALAHFVNAHVPERAEQVRVRVRELRGGLVSQSVRHVALQYQELGKARRRSFVVKRLDGVAVREAAVYEGLLKGSLRGMVPALYGVTRRHCGLTHLCLEAVVPAARWPWSDVSLASAVLTRVSELHRAPLRHPALEDWDYGRELELTARSTVEAAESLGSTLCHPSLKRSLPALRRLERSLPRIRAELLAFRALPRAVVHGDLHPGNVVVRRRAGKVEPILVDWARARLGSPLEDVASFLQWLGFWEPAVRQKHDSLLGAYLSARGLARLPSAELRSAYWLAGALNCFSGAMTYHLSVAADERRSAEQRAAGARALHDCSRVVRRADAYWS